MSFQLKKECPIFKHSWLNCLPCLAGALFARLPAPLPLVWSLTNLCVKVGGGQPYLPHEQRGAMPSGTFLQTCSSLTPGDGTSPFVRDVGQTSPTSHICLSEIRPGEEVQGALQGKKNTHWTQQTVKLAVSKNWTLPMVKSLPPTGNSSSNWAV